MYLVHAPCRGVHILTSSAFVLSFSAQLFCLLVLRSFLNRSRAVGAALAFSRFAWGRSGGCLAGVCLSAPRFNAGRSKPCDQTLHLRLNIFAAGIRFSGLCLVHPLNSPRMMATRLALGVFVVESPVQCDPAWAHRPKPPRRWVLLWARRWTHFSCVRVNVQRVRLHHRVRGVSTRRFAPHL